MPSSPRAIVPDDIAHILTVADAQLSPDGRLVAYTRTEVDLERDGYRSAVWLVRADGGDPVRLTRGAGRDFAPRWSPDGRLLAFLSDRDGQPPQLYLLPLDGGEPWPLTALAGGGGPAVWAPDGSRIAFCARVATDAPPADRGARERWAQRPRVVTRAQYKTDGAGYTHDAVSQIFVASLDGAASQRTIAPADHATPAWSPDGGRLAFARARAGVADYNLFDLWMMDADGHNAHRLTDAVGRVVAPSWSPDGRTIAFYGHDAQESGLGDAMVRVWVAPAAGGPARAVTARHHRGVALARPPEATAPPAWSADGRTLAVPIADAGSVHVARVSVADGAVRSVVGGDRQVQGHSVAAGRIAFCATEWHVPSDLYACRDDGSEERRLTQVNAGWLSAVALPRVERRAFPSPNGGALDGWVVHPASGRRPAPLLLEIHGGPHSYHGNAFPSGALHVFVLASRGWAVLELNPTGSGSYDQAFAHGIRGRWGEHDLGEQLAAVDALCASGVADPARLAVSGYSYGGFMAAWTITHTNRFKAAIVGAPVVNFESFHGTSDIGPWFAPWELRGDLVAQRETYRRLSPIHYVERVVTPTLIVHGEADDRCPIGQGEELYIGMVAAGRAPAEFVRYPGQSHAFRGSGRPSHRIDVVRRVADWAERHTPGAA